MCIVSGYTVFGSRNALPTKWGIPGDPGFDAWAGKLIEFTRTVWVTYLQDTGISSRLYSVKTSHRHDLRKLVHLGPHTLTGEHVITCVDYVTVGITHYVADVKRNLKVGRSHPAFHQG
jgi:hypothetical protein